MRKNTAVGASLVRFITKPLKIMTNMPKTRNTSSISRYSLSSMAMAMYPGGVRVRGSE
jgi:hypothetical protein